MFGLQRAVDKKSIFITGEKIEPNVLKQKLGREKSIWKKKMLEMVGENTQKGGRNNGEQEIGKELDLLCKKRGSCHKACP